jgi:hypothetical protein
MFLLSSASRGIKHQGINIASATNIEAHIKATSNVSATLFTIINSIQQQQQQTTHSNQVPCFVE